MSNPLNEQISELLATIIKLEQQRDKEQEALDTLGAFPYTSLSEAARGKLQPRIELLARLNSKIDSQRQKLISLELLALDNSVKALQSTTTQVPTSSTRLENFTRLLIYLTALLGVVSIFNTGVVTLQFNWVGGLAVIVTSSIAMAYLALKAAPKIQQVLKH